MINVFIDANIWLSLYDFSDDDLKQFSKLSDLIDRDVAILLPEQVRDEVFRNRETKIKTALKTFGEFQTQIPNIFKGYSREYQDLKAKMDALLTLRKEFIKQVEKDAIAETLHADAVIKKVFEKIPFWPCTNEIVCEAIMRFNIGKPPGKDKKYGDAINWMTLLQYAPESKDLFFVSADKDYRSILNDKFFNPYLSHEWRKKKKSALHFYRNLTDFINNHVMTIELKTENEKRQRIDDLRESGSFSNTHSAIEQLNRYASWTLDQIDDLCQIACENDQVRRILSDCDVLTFYETILRNFHNEQNNDYVASVFEFVEKAKNLVDPRELMSIALIKKDGKFVVYHQGEIQRDNMQLKWEVI